jgi:hypothetical protein
MLQATAEVNKEYADAEAKKAASGGGRKGKKSAEDKAADKAARNTSIADLKEETALLQKEAEVVGLGAEAREKALTAMKLENDLRHDNVKITPEVVASIEAESTAYAKAKEHLADLERQTQQMHDLQQFVGDNMVDILSGIATGATTAEDALKGLVDQLLRAMLQAMLLGQGPLAGLFGLGGGTSTGVGGMVGMMFGGARAGGGPVMPGRAYMVGEKGPELFVPRMAGVVQSSGGSGHTQVSVHVTPSPLLITTWDTKATAAENRAVARGPAVARNNNQRYSVP